MFSSYKATATSVLLMALLLASCSKEIKPVQPANDAKEESLSGSFANAATKPNIILLLADDIGYEVPSYSGGQSYTTPNLDKLAANGMQFTHCYSTPDCCPSRVELMSGKYNFRNYIDWGLFDLSQKTFINYLHDAGYATCVAGKWQMGNGDMGIKQMGFDKYLVFDALASQNDDSGTGRYKNPELYQNGAYLSSSQTQGKYSEDMFVDYISHFIDSNKKKPFFIYYALNLCHQPFSPTPDDPEFASWNPTQDRSNKKYFPSMVKYMDKKIGQIMSKIDSLGLSKNTVFVFSGDNGTPAGITSLYKGRSITGGKDLSTEFGVHVPLLVSCPSKIATGSAQPAIVDFSDFFTTFTDIAKVPSSQLLAAGFLDSHSFYSYLLGSTPSLLRNSSYCYWKPITANELHNKHFVQDTMYKLYDSTNANRFYNIQLDSFEKKPLKDNQLSPQERQTKQTFQNVIASMHN